MNKDIRQPINQTEKRFDPTSEQTERRFDPMMDRNTKKVEDNMNEPYRNTDPMVDQTDRKFDPTTEQTERRFDPMMDRNTIKVEDNMNEANRNVDPWMNKTDEAHIDDSIEPLKNAAINPPRDRDHESENFPAIDPQVPIDLIDPLNESMTEPIINNIADPMVDPMTRQTRQNLEPIENTNRDIEDFVDVPADPNETHRKFDVQEDDFTDTAKKNNREWEKPVQKPIH